MTLVVGIDPSLTSTGIAVLDTLDFGDRRVETIRSAGKEDANLYQRRDRLRRMVEQIVRPVSYQNDCLVVIEAPAYNSRSGHQHDRSGLWWLVVDELRQYDTPIVEVQPQLLKQYATGKGNASKAEVIIAVTRRYPDVEITNDNEADALVLAAMGARYVGRPIEDSLPQRHIDAMAAVKWPTALKLGGAA